MPPRIVIRDLPDVWRTRIPVGQTGLFASGPIVRLVVHNQGDLGLINLQARLQRIVCLDRPEHEEARIIDYHGAPLRWGGMGEGQPKTLNPDDFGFLELLRSMDMGLLMFENGMVAKEHPDIPPGKKAMELHYPQCKNWPVEVVKTGDSLKTGSKTIQFLETRMVHWPDSMFSYIPEDKLLISSDGFGHHWATSERFDDEVDENEVMAHAAKYYANILLLYSPLIQKLLTSVSEMGLAIDCIAPDHGVIWRSNPGRMIEAYDRWSRQETKAKAVVVYDTMWHATDIMAHAVADGLIDEGVSVKLMNLAVNHRSDVMTEVLDAKAVILGSSTLNNGMLPRMADMIQYMKGLKPTGRVGGAFGSYGWSGEAVKQMTKHLEEMKFQIVGEGVRSHFRPQHDDLHACRDLGLAVAKAIKAS